MYAIVQHGGHQYRLAPGDRLLVDRMAAEVGSMITLEPVLLLGDTDGGVSALDAARGARVAAVVVGHRLGRKLRVYKYKPKKRYRRTHGHRSRYTELRVEALLAAGQPVPAAATAPAGTEPAVGVTGAAGGTEE
jgi:large subunit ribosomal protein L21